jgi:hypothetical protein
MRHQRIEEFGSGNYQPSVRAHFPKINRGHNGSIVTCRSEKCGEKHNPHGGGTVKEWAAERGVVPPGRRHDSHLGGVR